jgi:hypothetical protein
VVFSVLFIYLILHPMDLRGLCAVLTPMRAAR